MPPASYSHHWRIQQHWSNINSNIVAIKLSQLKWGTSCRNSFSCLKQWIYKICCILQYSWGIGNSILYTKQLPPHSFKNLAYIETMYSEWFRVEVIGEMHYEKINFLLQRYRNFISRYQQWIKNLKDCKWVTSHIKERLH